MPEQNSNLIPMGWELKKFEEIINKLTDYVANGSFASLRENVKYNYNEDYAVLIRLQDFRNNFLGPFVYVDNKSYDFLKKSSLQPNDIIISNVGAHAGTVFRAPNFKIPMTLGPNAILFRSNVNDNFMYFWLTSEIGQESITNIITTTAQPKFNKTDLKEIKCIIPPLNEQKKIASILSTVDDLIENTTNLINSYTLLKKGLMQTLLTKGIGHTKFKKTEIGEIPEEWELKSLDKIFSMSAGRDLAKEAFSPKYDNEHTYPIYSNSLENKGLYGYSKFARHKANSITITARGTLGKANSRNEDFDAIGRLIVIEPIIDLDCFFISEYINEKVKFFIESTGVPQLTVPQASRYLVALPPLSEQKKISSILITVDDRLELFKLKKMQLNLLKKGLMQQLLTGKIRVKV